uniref:Nudix (nucleoside diphosphate linked moiety X)-type motif 9 n=1 Tax=Oncorhynchus mykiss TaxID=8022 RepID=A0A8C7UUR9_ONCMY
MVRVGRNWVGPIQIELTLLGFPYCLCISGISVFTMPSSAPHSKTQQFPVPDDKVDWKTDWPQYSPVSYTATSVLIKPVWADQDIGCERERGLQINFFILSLLYVSPPYRWKRESAGQQVSRPVSKLPVLQFVSIIRRDCGEWAIPGGCAAPQRNATPHHDRSCWRMLQAAERSPRRLQTLSRLSHVLSVYNGYVDNPRNNDNSWMETGALNFHDDTGNSVSELPMQVGDDAGQVHWIDLDSVIAKERHAHW